LGSPTFAVRKSLTIRRGSAFSFGDGTDCGWDAEPPAAGPMTSGDDEVGTPEHAVTQTAAQAALMTRTP
jgi:hypothetical protein